jgi:hypothetical protein
LLVRAPTSGAAKTTPSHGARVEAGVDLFVLGERAAR